MHGLVLHYQSCASKRTTRLDAPPPPVGRPSYPASDDWHRLDRRTPGTLSGCRTSTGHDTPTEVIPMELTTVLIILAIICCVVWLVKAIR